MKSNLRNEIKSYIVRSGYTMQEVVDRLSEDYGWSDSVSNLSNKLQRESLRYVEAVQLADALAEILQRNKYHVDTVYNGEDGLHYASTGIYDCIVLDIMLPILDGISVLRMLRKQKISTPVLLLTAKSDVADKINGLDSGADDYLTKPFVTGELLARIRALTRRTGEVAVDGLQFHNLRLDSQNYTLSYGQEQIKLSLKEYQIMEIFMSNPKQIVSKEFFSQLSQSTIFLEFFQTFVYKFLKVFLVICEQEVDVWLFIRFKLNSLQVAQFIIFDDCINSWCIKNLEVVLTFIQTCQHLCNIFICVVKFNWLV